jgi:hypothetical protein
MLSSLSLSPSHQPQKMKEISSKVPGQLQQFCPLQHVPGWDGVDSKPDTLCDFRNIALSLQGKMKAVMAWA